MGGARDNASADDARCVALVSVLFALVAVGLSLYNMYSTNDDLSVTIGGVTYGLHLRHSPECGRTPDRWAADHAYEANSLALPSNETWLCLSGAETAPYNEWACANPAARRHKPPSGSMVLHGPWEPKHVYHTGAVVIAPSGDLQLCTAKPVCTAVTFVESEWRPLTSVEAAADGSGGNGSPTSEPTGGAPGQQGWGAREPLNYADPTAGGLAVLGAAIQALQRKFDAWTAYQSEFNGFVETNACMGGCITDTQVEGLISSIRATGHSSATINQMCVADCSDERVEIQRTLDAMGKQFKGLQARLTAAEQQLAIEPPSPSPSPGPVVAPAAPAPPVGSLLLFLVTPGQPLACPDGYLPRVGSGGTGTVLAPYDESVVANDCATTNTAVSPNLPFTLSSTAFSTETSGSFSTARPAAVQSPDLCHLPRTLVLVCVAQLL